MYNCIDISHMEIMFALTWKIYQCVLKFQFYLSLSPPFQAKFLSKYVSFNYTLNTQVHEDFFFPL